MDATDITAPELRSRGCSVALLYNRASPSGSRLQSPGQPLHTVNPQLSKDTAAAGICSGGNLAPGRHHKGLHILQGSSLAGALGLPRRDRRPQAARSRRTLQRLFRRHPDSNHRPQSGSECVKRLSEHLSGMSPGFTLVAGIQRPDVCRVKRLFQLKDLSWLDSCDEHRNDGEFGNRIISRATCCVMGKVTLSAVC
jgi:hypothetical protein